MCPFRYRQLPDDAYRIRFGDAGGQVLPGRYGPGARDFYAVCGPGDEAVAYDCAILNL